MNTLWVTRGLPGSGKTTWARNHIDEYRAGPVVRINRDDLRRMALHETWAYSSCSERAIVDIRNAALSALLTDGYHVVCDDTNLNPKRFQELVDFAGQIPAHVEVVDFRDVPLEECIRRDAQRTSRERVGEDLIREMHYKFIQDPRTRVLQFAREIVNRPGYDALK